MGENGHNLDQITQLERELQRLRSENHRLKTAGSGQPHSWRRWTQGLLLTLGLLALIPASLLIWLNRTITTADGYLKAVGPVIHEPAVQRSIQKASAGAILSRVNLDQTVSQALPESAQFLAAPMAAQLQNYTYDTIGTIVASPKFADLWVSVNQRAQQQFLDIARTSSGDPVVNVSDLYQFVSAQLAGTNLAVLAGRELPPQIGNIHVATIPALERIPQFVAALSAWSWSLMALTVLLLAGSIWAANNRRQALVWTGLGVMGAALVTLAMVRITRNLALSQVTDPTYNAGAMAIWQTILNPFFVEIFVLGVLGMAVVLLGWLLGDSHAAIQIRLQCRRYLVAGRAKVWPTAESTAFLRFIQRHRTSLRGLLLVTTGLVLLLNTPLTLTTTTAILFVAVLALIILEFLATPATTTPQPPKGA
jgi:hypothetical protein